MCVLPRLSTYWASSQFKQSYQFTDYRLPTTHNRLSLTNFRLPITNYPLLTTDNRLPLTNFQLPITDFQ